MAAYNSCRSIPAIAGADLSAAMYKFGVYSSGNIVVASVAQSIVDGIIGEGVASGGSFPLVVPDGGIAMVMAGASVAVDALVATDASGLAITYVEAVQNTAIGKALKAASANDIFPIQFVHKKTGGGS